MKNNKFNKYEKVELEKTTLSINIADCLSKRYGKKVSSN